MPSRTTPACGLGVVFRHPASLGKHPTDLVVLAVRQYRDHMRWLEKSVGKSVASTAGQMTLFIPHGVEGFVSQELGALSSEHSDPDYDKAAAAAERRSCHKTHS